MQRLRLFGPRSDVRLSESQRKRIWDKTFFSLKRQGWSTPSAMREASRRLDTAYPPPPKPLKPPFYVRIGLWFVSHALPDVEVKMSPFAKKLIVSLAFGVGAVTVLLQTALSDGVISGAEWAEILPAFFIAAWGKFSSNTTVLAPSRKGESIAGPQ